MHKMCLIWNMDYIIGLSPWPVMFGFGETQRIKIVQFTS